MTVRMASPIGREAQRPNPALLPLVPLLGRWRTTGMHRLIPGTTLHGRTSLSGTKAVRFVLMRSEIDKPEDPQRLKGILDLAISVTKRRLRSRPVHAGMRSKP